METPYLYKKQSGGILKTLAFMLFAFSLFNGCKKFIQVPPPISTLVTADVFNNASTATSAVTEIYTQMVNNQESYNMSFDNGLLADEFTNYSTNSTNLNFYQDNLRFFSQNGGGYTGCWINAYNYIYEANAVIAALQNNSAISVQIKNQLTGETQVIRAFWFFYLVNEFGDVPMPLTPSYSINAALSRTPKAQVYQQMATDLLSAETLLNSNYVDGTDTMATTDRVRPNKAVAAALLARVYLYAGDYKDAITQATNVINNPAYQLASPLSITNYGFTMDNSEAIWQLYTPLPSQQNGATVDGTNYILTSTPANSNSQVSLSPQLLSAFEPGDLRRSVWVDSIIVEGQTYYFPYKYQTSANTNTTGAITEYTMVLRLGEQYLIRAEAEADMGDAQDIANAETDLDKIRRRAGLPNYAGATDQTSLLAAILHERQVELFTEWGARWFDLIRMGYVNSVMGSPGNICHLKGGTWSPNSALYPISFLEITADPHITQNPGY